MKVLVTNVDFRARSFVTHRGDQVMLSPGETLLVENVKDGSQFYDESLNNGYRITTHKDDEKFDNKDFKQIDYATHTGVKTPDKTVNSIPTPDNVIYPMDGISKLHPPHLKTLDGRPVPDPVKTAESTTAAEAVREVEVKNSRDELVKDVITQEKEVEASRPDNDMPATGTPFNARETLSTFKVGELKELCGVAKIETTAGKKVDLINVLIDGTTDQQLQDAIKEFQK